MAQSSNYADGLEVYISTTGNQLADFTTTLYAAEKEPAEWTYHEFSLNDYSGQTIHIAFRNNSTDKILLFVDDISIFQQDNYDLKISDKGFTNGIEYPITPKTQCQPVSFYGEVKNIGLNDLTNA